MKTYFLLLSFFIFYQTKGAEYVFVTKQEKHICLDYPVLLAAVEVALESVCTEAGMDDNQTHHIKMTMVEDVLRWLFDKNLTLLEQDLRVRIDNHCKGLESTGIIPKETHAIWTGSCMLAIMDSVMQFATTQV